MEEGITLNRAVAEFIGHLNQCDTIVAHNLAFDNKVMGAEMIRADLRPEPSPERRKICTKEATTKYCAIPNPNRWGGNYKWPKLEELHWKLFEENFENAHNALGDIRATARCFFELVRRKVIVLENSKV